MTSIQHKGLQTYSVKNQIISIAVFADLIQSLSRILPFFKTTL